MEYQHQSLAAGKWYTLSFVEQMGNIGSEVGRAALSQENKERFEGAVGRAFELMDITISDPRWKGRLKEIVRMREVFGDAISGGHEYGSTLEDLDKYFYHFAYAARANR